MTTNFTHDAGMAGAGISFGGGLMVWIGDNANAIGAIVAVLSLLLTAVFLYLNYRLNLKRLEFDRRNSKKADK